MKKIICFIFLTFAAAFTWAIGVDEEEIESAKTAAVEFENYGGPYAVIESADAITGIGVSLGKIVALDVETPSVIEPGAKYTLIHSVSKESSGKLDADILVLNTNAGVDHIKNLRRILTGFLSEAYGYTKEDAETIATFVTLYNAVYRNDLNNFKAKYKDAVIENLSENKVGLSTNWEDWAGNTQIVIPLRDPDGGISTVDTTTISDDKVVEALKEEEDKGVDVREKLTDIKSTEATTASQKAKDAQKEAAEQKKQGNTEKAEESAKTSTEQQKLADTKTKEVTEEKKDIAKDKETLAVEKPAYVPVTGLFGAEGKNKLYRLITLDSVTGKILLKSQVTQVRSKVVYIVNNITVTDTEEGTKTYPEMYLAVCGINDNHSAVRLCLIDTEQLIMRKQSQELLSETSEFVQYKDDFYVVIQEGKNFYVATYSKDAVLKQKSSVTVNAATPLNMTANGLLVTDSSGVPVLLDPSTLKTVWTSFDESISSKSKGKKKNSRSGAVEK